MKACHPEVFVNKKRDLSASRESVLCALLFQVDLLLEVRVLDNFHQRSGDPREICPVEDCEVSRWSI